MRHVSISSSASAKLVRTVILICCLEVSLLVLAEDLPSISAGKLETEDNQQVEDMSKRDWNKDLKMWGKRAWSSLHGGWGLKRSAPAWDDQMDYEQAAEKRAWQRLQGAWGKRFAPDDELAINQLASMLERDQQMEQPYAEYGPEDDVEVTEEEKRNWNKFNGGWGKRTKWDKLRGAWGKRDPAWSNLKGIWGKRDAYGH